ncbi:Tn3 family transposase [Streptosporangium vulgare]|uniref:Tn3 family transposase n=1 Tax=Streptosporangium vulgare TaxID=46190 RepID=A0ABV5TS86_9ACTN
MTRPPLHIDELVEHWTILDEERDLIAGKRGATRLAFGILLKFYTQHGRFPRGRSELPDEVVEHVAKQVKVSASELGFYEWSGSTIEYHRSQIRKHLGFRLCSTADATKVAVWLAENVANAERRPERVREELLKHLRENRIEPPTPGRITRIVGSALRQAETAWSLRITSRLDADTIERICALADITFETAQDQAASAAVQAPGVVDAPATEPEGSTQDDDEADFALLAFIKSAVGNVSLESMMTEIRKLVAVRSIGLPPGLFADVAPKVLAAWRSRAAVEAPSHMRTHPPELAVLLLAALVHEREREITDTLVELLIATVHRIKARADSKVTKELINAFKRVTGKENILFKVADAALGHPDEAVRAVIFPAVAGGEQTLKDLVHEFKTKGPVYRTTVQTTLRASYTNHYRRGLIALLETLEFKSTNTAYQPVIKALELVRRYAKAGNTTYYPRGETVPEHRGTAGAWEDLVFKTDKRGRRRVVRMVYEIVTFQALREALRCKEIWVVGAHSFRDPEEDLPKDFPERRVENYAELRKPLAPRDFIAELKAEMRAELEALDAALPKLDWVEIAERKAGAIKLTKIGPVEEPRNLRKIKNEVSRRWGSVPLIDMLKEAVLRTGCLNAVTSVAGNSSLKPEILAERLMLAIFGYGTNTGIRAVASGGHAHSEDDIRYVRRRYLTPQIATDIAIAIANATFAARDASLWGEGTTTVASDSTHVRAYDQNIFTEWHSRYGGRGILIYWHVERGSMVVHSQTLRASASEVHAMVEGAVRHGTTMKVEGNYVDSHGQSEIGFGVTRLLGFDLLPRIKQINKVKLYRVESGESDLYSRLTPAMTRPIRWEVIEQNYDQMIKYATAIKQGTAATEAILRRFTDSASHPTYQAMLEVGRAQKTIFVARYLRLRELQREIQEGLNVVESSNGANSVIFYGKGGDIATNRREELEMTVLCLRILQAALVYINTLMLQDVLADPAMAKLLKPADRRGLTPLFWQHVQPYGEVRLDVAKRLPLGDSTARAQAGDQA